MKRSSILLEDEPTQWGLRGDPLLWREMKARLGAISIAVAPDDLERILHELFEELTGKTLNEHEPIFVKRYDRGGMSSGMVCPEFWRAAVAATVSRYHAANGGNL